MSFRKTHFALLAGAYALPCFAAMEFKEAEITTIKNMVEHDPGSGANPAKVNEKIMEKSKVSTAAASMAELTFADSSITRMGANTRFSFQSKERLVKLEQGTVLIHTPPGNGGATVDCGGVTAAVSGTTFMASRDASGNAMFVLLEGQGGLTVTVGKSTAVIRPGQAASVGADAIQEASSPGSADASTVSRAPGASAASDDNKAGGTGGSGQGSASSGASESGTPPSAAAPKIQVFDVDVKKVVATTPLIAEFKSELPSAPKIEKTIETQQIMVKEGTLENLGVEVVAVKSKDGDPLVGAPRVEKEEMVVVNKRTDLVGRGNTGDGLDIDTAAGPGAGGGPPADARPVAQAAPAPASGPLGPSGPAAPAAPAINTIGQIATGTTTPIRPAPTSLTLSFFGALGVVTLDQPTDRARTVTLDLPGTLSVTIPAGSRTTTFTVSPAGLYPGVSGNASVTAVSEGLSASASLAGVFANPAVQQAVEDANPIRDLLGQNNRSSFSWSSDSLAEGYELDLGGGQTIRLTSSYYEADGNFTTAKVRSLGARAVAPEQDLTGFVSSNDMPAAEMVALDNYFYFSGKPAGITDGPSDFFVNAAAERTLAPSDHGSPVNLGMAEQSYGLYTAKTWKAGATPLIPADGGVEKKIFYGDRIDLTSSGAFWDGLSLWDGRTPPVLDSEQRWANFLGRIADAPDAATLVWDDQGGSVNGAADIYLGGLRELSLGAGGRGIAMQGATLGASQAGVDLTTSGNLEIKTAKITGIGAYLALEAAGKVKLGAQTVAGKVPTETEAKEQQVRLEAMETSVGAPAGAPLSMAVIRTGDSLEMRNVTIRNFDGTKLENVTRNADGTTSLNGRILMSGSAVKDFKIKELVGAAVNADAKIQMMAMDTQGNLAGEMMVEGQLPVATKLAKQLDASITGPLGDKAVHASSVDLAAKTVNFNNATITAMNAITARANTVIVQNSLMTVIRSSGVINMYVREGAVNMGFGTVRDGYANFAGANMFQFGSVAFNISNQDQLNSAYGTKLFDTVNSAGVQAGAINVLKL